MRGAPGTGNLIRRTSAPAAVLLVLALAACAGPAARRPDVGYGPTHLSVVAEMLRAAGVHGGDVVDDLGSGDGRIVITTARLFGARGVGVEIDPRRVAQARASARRAGVAHLVTFVEGDLFDADIGAATVVTLYLSDAVNLRLRPKLLAELRPGTRVVSHQHDMGDWLPARTLHVAVGRRRHAVHCWVVPPPLTGGHRPRGALTRPASRRGVGRGPGGRRSP